jgi:hypothetical protein
VRAVETRVGTDEYDRPQIHVSYVLTEREKELVTLTWQVMNELNVTREEAAGMVLVSSPDVDDAFLIYLVGGTYTNVESFPRGNEEE